jgi:hypothetical protein
MNRRKSILVWGKVITTDYYGEWESIVVKGEDVPDDVDAEYPHGASNADKKMRDPRVVKLKKGMRVQVKWPNSQVTLEQLSIVEGTGSAQIDMNGGPDSFETRQLCVQTEYNGVKVNVPLTGRRVGVLL